MTLTSSVLHKPMKMEHFKRRETGPPHVAEETHYSTLCSPTSTDWSLVRWKFATELEGQNKRGEGIDPGLDPMTLNPVQVFILMQRWGNTLGNLNGSIQHPVCIHCCDQCTRCEGKPLQRVQSLVWQQEALPVSQTS